MSIADKLKTVKESLGNCQLVAVSKTKPNEDLIQAYEAGQRALGENKVQELTDKAEALPKDIEWHMIGHLQRNKVKYIAPFVHLIHSVDSVRLLKEINKQGRKIDRVIPVLLQIHIAEEENKYGLDEEELHELLSSEAFNEMNHVDVQGLMGMATFTDDKDKIRREFKSLKKLFDKTAKDYNDEKLNLKELSMGMSGDYEIAIEEGSTMVRIGSKIFGER
ncbi:YggS family pyridoxal phosphate-dependent enzyme [Marivirga harenae]|uniref:YggS family pyridoxal phosphate-dependent enzyme n=1 Tax=Marivirga harenae TaxID=2010992 RepID=UPI0026E10B88|nr:YggS family pyridoxal phosphate-dependent enzyme [Marivirga harenae]WKV12456.1 YggS family pyridoxal phosphate-dependent enzyme [Marivirga harenae]|tara:strand:+ start:76246 stop:76905 length:660 start_codon:yes stop_codon:yes gene_type:complete